MTVPRSPTSYGPGSGVASRFPDLNASEDEILQFRDRHFNFYSVYRNRHMERMARSLHYFLGHQWVELDRDVILDQNRGYVLRTVPQRDGSDLPRPVTNLISPAVEVELAALNKRQLVPKVVPTSDDPRTEAAARVANEVLQDRMQKLRWPQLRERVALNAIITGTACIKSWWDENWSDLTRIGSPWARACPVCGGMVSSPYIPADQRELIKTNTDTLEEADNDLLRMQHCPTCGGREPLQPTELGEESLYQQDMLGFDLGVDVPRGNTNLAVVSPFYLYPENSGLDVTPETCRLYGEASIKSMEWVEEHLPDEVSNLYPEPPEDLMESHPILGEWSLMGWYNSTLDSAVYDNHVRVYELHHNPTRRLPGGRSITIINDRIVRNEKLVREYTSPDGSERIEVKGTLYACARFKERDGEFWGQSLVDDQISMQNRLNGGDSQTVDARERMGSPNMLVSEGMELSGPEWFEEYGGGKIMTFIRDPMAPTEKPELFGQAGPPPGWSTERGQIKEDMRLVAGPAEIEQGIAPKNITTTSGLALLGENADQVRAPRERSLVAMSEELWQHQMELLWVLRTDPDEYQVDTASGKWEVKQYSRTNLMGQIHVRIEKQAFVEKSIYQKEAAREAQADGLYDITSPVAKRKLLELRGLPTDINEDLDFQVEEGKKQWLGFKDDGVIPVIDPSLDNAAIRFEVFRNYLLTEDGKIISNSAGWPQILPSIVGWEEDLAIAEQKDMLARAFYGKVPQEVANEKYASGMLEFGAANAEFQMAQQQTQAALQQFQVAQATGQPAIPPPPLPLPPQPPPEPLFLPRSKDLRIFSVWMQMLSENPPALPPGSNRDPQGFAKAREMYLRFRSVVEAYRLMAAGAGVPGQPAMAGTGIPPQPPNPPNPTNMPTPGTSEAMANAGAAMTGGQ